MGAKVGKRVYWPGSGIYCPDPELLEIGDDVVFGSRSELFTSDNMPMDEITGPTDTQSLTLITCGGAFDYVNGQYLQRTVVRATRSGPGIPVT